MKLNLNKKQPYFLIQTWFLSNTMLVQYNNLKTECRMCQLFLVHNKWQWFLPREVTWLPSESITLHKNTGKGVFSTPGRVLYWPMFRVWNYYELILFWDKRGTFLSSEMWYKNMGISHNLQNDRGRWSIE